MNGSTGTGSGVPSDSMARGQRTPPPGQASALPVAGRLDRNLTAMAIGSPETVQRLREAEGSLTPGASFAEARDGLLTATLTDAMDRRQSMGSGHRPGDEADRLAETVDLDASAAVVVLGFALGHHVRSILSRARSSALVIVYEPDTALLRAVLERQDHAGWLCDPLVRVLTDAEDAAAIGAALEGSEGLVSMGLTIVSHPPSAPRLGASADRFAQRLTDAVRSIRTQVVTTLAQADATIRNQLMNLDAYVASPGIERWRGSLAGRPAVVISAGPSVRRNLHRLTEPGVRDRVLLVAAQTMLKPMLDAGVRPHIVTALDYHEISRRFYEGLSAQDVEGVTLVVEAKANAAIFEAWPGPPGSIVCPADGFLDQMLGEGPWGAPGSRGTLKAGATVAHLAYYVARSLGCDPVALIGQDLGFTDGQYYAAGASIHRVWGGELCETSTLETLEWQRIKRMGGRLIPAIDHLGRPVYTDEQMHTYRAQFERDFAEDRAAGRTVIDATEGGVSKQGALVMTLEEALSSMALSDAQSGPIHLLDDSVPGDGRAMLMLALERLREVRRGVWRVGELSRRAHGLMEQMREHADDQPRVNRLIEEVYALRDEVKAIKPAWDLVQTINQRGTFRRAKADRAIHLHEGTDALERQRAQISRDAENVRGLADAADTLGELMDAAIRAHDGRSTKLTREAPTPVVATRPTSGSRHSNVWAAVTVDPDRSDLGLPRDLTQPVAEGRTALRLTLERLARVRGIGGIALATAHRGLAARAAGVDVSGGVVSGVEIRFVEVDADPVRQRSSAVRGARLLAARCWRGGLGGWTYADELVHPEALDAVVRATGASALLLAGSDWGLVDPSIGTSMVERFAEAPGTNGLVFSQAAVGAAPVLLDAKLIESIRAKRYEAGAFASVGSVLGYVPIKPANDPIAGPACLQADAALRDLGERLTLDTPDRVARLGGLAAMLGDRPLTDLLNELASACVRPGSPEHLTLELTGLDGSAMPFDTARSLIREAASQRPDLALTLAAQRSPHSLADPLDSAALPRLIQAARSAGVGFVHVRTPLSTGAVGARTLLETVPDVVSVALVANDASTYEMLTGRAWFEASREGISALLTARESAPKLDGVPSPWLLPRITRRDAVYGQLEAMYDRWLLACGACVIDPLPETVAGDRISPLPLPAHSESRLARTCMTIGADGAWRSRDGMRVSTSRGLLEAWRSIAEEPKPAKTGPKAGTVETAA